MNFLIFGRTSGETTHQIPNIKFRRIGKMIQSLSAKYSKYNARKTQEQFATYKNIKANIVTTLYKHKS